MKLKNHTLIILLLFLILFVCIGSVNALESQTDNIGENNVISISESPEILTASPLDDAVGVSIDENVISSNNRDWYVNASAADGGDGSKITPYKNFKSVLDNANLQDGDSVYFAGNENYKGNRINVNLYIDKQLNLLKYGSGEAVFDAEHKSRIFTVDASCFNITGLTFINGNADQGGAIYFGGAISNSNINATYTNNAANFGDGGVNYFSNDVSNSNITGTYNHNTASCSSGVNRFDGDVSNSNIAGTYNHNAANNGDGGANHFLGCVSNSNIAGTYNHNIANRDGGANNFHGYVLNSTITGTYANNKANGQSGDEGGGANYFWNSVSNSKITGTYINNTAKYSIIHFGYFDPGLDAEITNAIFLNNKCQYEIGALSSGVAVKNSWFGNNASNYMDKPNNYNVQMGSWLFLNGTNNQNDIKFFLMRYNGKTTSEYDNTLLPKINLTLTTTDGTLDKSVVGLDETVKFSSTESGINRVTAQIEDAVQTIEFSMGDFDLLQGVINNATSSVINLTRNYTYNQWDTMTEGVLIDRNVTINGNGFTIDAKGKSRIFKVTAGSINITDVTFKNGKADNGGAIYFENAISNSNIAGTYINNTADYGGANHFNGDVSNSNIAGIYINNTASNSIIHFENYYNHGFDAYITNAIFLNNNCTYEIYARTPGVVVKDSWFGNNASNYMNKPNNYNVQMDSWLFLNGTNNQNDIKFFLMRYDGKKTSEYDNTLLPKINLTLTTTDGTLDKSVVSPDETVKFSPTESGIKRVTAQIEYTAQTIEFSMGDFNLLQEIINNATSSVINLTRNYTYNQWDRMTGGVLIDRNVTINGNGFTIDAKGKSRIFKVTAGSINITDVTFKNGKAYEGGAIYFENAISNSNINATYINNTAYYYGGANYFQSSVSNSTINGTYTNNKATDRGYYMGGGANYFNNDVLNSNITGTYTNNTANRDGGANHFYKSVSNSNITGTYTNNTANYLGGVNYFNMIVLSSNIIGTYTNNNATNDGGANNFNHDVSNSNIIGTYTNNTAYDGGANNFNNVVSNSTITGTYTNNTAKKYGGANNFWYIVSGSNIGGTYTNNNATNNGGANNFERSVSNSTINGTYTNNTANNLGGANNFLGSVSNSTINGTYTNNKANGQYEYEGGGANNFYSVSNSNITGTYINNTATNNGGANNFVIDVSCSNVGGTYINNTASNAIIHFVNLFNQDLDAYITNAIFLNNNCTYEIYASTSGVAVKDSWFGNNASNYMNKPNINDNVRIDNWLFLNATADCTSLLILDSLNITFKLYSTDGTNVSDFDNSRLPVVNLTLAATNGDVEKTTTLDNIVKYMATEQGKGSVTAKIENATYTICFDNLLRNVDLSVSAENITYPENEILTLTYNNTATGKVNITLESKNYNKTIETDINQTITIADLPAGEYNVTVEYSGDNVFSNATSYANFTVEKITTEVILDKESIDLFVDDEYNITYTLKPDYAVGSISFSSNDSSIASVDSISGNIQAKAEGSANITISFSGSENYTASHATITVNVKRIPTQITVNSSSIDMKVNDEADIGAILEPANAGNLTYTVSNPSIVKVEDGKIIAIKEGNATITVSFEGNKKYLPAENKTINVTVRLNDASVKVNNNTLNLLVDETFNLIATTEPKDLTVNFTSSNPSVVTVDNKGNVLAVGEGNATITVTVDGDGKYVENSTTVTVTVSKVPTEISINPDSLDLFVGDETVIAANLTPSDAGNVTFTSSDENIVTVDNQGNVIAEGKGQAIITVSFAGDNKYAAAENKTITVTVSLNDANVTVDNDTLDLKVDETYKINATKHPDTIMLDITYTSSDESVATVDKNGVVTAHGEGTAIITLEVGDDEIYAKNSTAVTVTVSKIPTEINIDNATVTLNVGVVVSTGAALNPEKAGNLTYKSDDESVAIVKGGKIIALKEGDAIITVSFVGDNKYAAAENKTIKVTVKKLNPIMDVSADEITEGENATISVTLPGDATGNVTTKVNGKTYSSPVENGKAVITIPDLEYGNYTLPVTYSGDDKYNPLTKDVNLTVKEDEIIVSALDLTKYYSGPEPFTVNVTYANGRAIAGKEVKITVNSVTYTRTTDENGTVSLNINLNVGTYDVAVEVDNISVDSMVTVLSTINASDIESKTKNLVFTASFIDGEGNYLTDGTNVSFNIKGVIYDSQVTGDKGLASINLTLDSGRYIITSYNPVSDEYTSNSIAVDLKDVVMTLSGDEITVGENAIISVSLPDDAAGNVTATVNGKTYTNNVNNGKANIIIPDLAAGNYTVPVIYSGDDKYNGAKGDANVTVNKADAAISIDVPPITEGDNATVSVTLPGDATGKVTVGNEIIPVKDGTASVVLTGLKAGITTVPVTYSGDDKYNSIETSADVIVNEKPVPAKENLTIKATADEITEGENATVIITGLENATGNVSLSVNGKTYTAPVNNGEATVTVPGLTENVTAVVNYPGDDKYNSAVTTVNITVNRNTVSITADNLTKYYKGPEKFTVKVTDAKGQAAGNKTVEITINGVTYKRTTDENGTAGLNINLNSGEYPVSIAVDDVTVNSTVTVMSTIDASDVVKVFRNDTQYYAKFTDVNGTALANITVSFNIQGIIYNRTTDAKGSAKLNINLNAGDYIITAVNPVNGEMKSNTIKVISLIESDDLTKYYRNSSQFVVRIHSADGGYVGAGEEVKFNINDVFYTRTTNATGHAKLNINLGQGNYTVTTYYKDCSRGNNIEVLPILSADDLVMKYRDGSQFKAKLVDGQGKAYTGQSVQFNINGVLYNRVTGSDGIAKLNINLMPGEYIITSNYNGASIANKITIRG